jgi:hypothetical protein
LSKYLYIGLLFSFTLLVSGSLTTAQTFNHNTGNIQVTVFQNGYIGHGGLGAGGNGITFSGSGDACFTAGMMYGNSDYGVSGMVGSFSDATQTIILIEDMVNTVPITNTSLTNFDQVSMCSYMDNLAPVPYGVQTAQTTYSNTGDDYIFIRLDITNPTASAINNFYAGMFGDWDIGGTAYLNNLAGLDQSRSLVYQWLSGGSPDPNYYGLVAFNGMAGGTANDLFPGDETTIRFVIRDWISTITPPGTITADYRSFIGSGPYNLDPGSTLVVGFGIVAGTSLADLQANTDAAQAVWDNTIVPVELTSFNASVNELNQVVLSWQTATETNNRIFEIERKDAVNNFATIGFVKGAGTTTEPKEYTYIDKNILPGTYTYRLKQIDFDGRSEYSKEVEISLSGPVTFDLSQNYPNPFNPSTIIRFSLPEQGSVKLSVYNTLGEEVAVLVNNVLPEGLHEVKFNAKSQPSGTYIYRLQQNNSVSIKKMLLLQ